MIIYGTIVPVCVAMPLPHTQNTAQTAGILSRQNAAGLFSKETQPKYKRKESHTFQQGRSIPLKVLLILEFGGLEAEKEFLPTFPKVNLLSPKVTRTVLFR